MKSTKKSTIDSKISKDFEKYANNSNLIKENGMEKMGKVLGIDIYTDIFITYFFYRCECKNFAEVTLEEYARGLQTFNVNNLADVKSK